METEIKKSIRNRFLELPEPVRDWLTSERATDIVIEFNKKNNFTDDLISVIPLSITRLVIKDLEEKDFVNELTRRLNIDKQKASAIYSEITEKILKPIGEFLAEIGIKIPGIEATGLVSGIISSPNFKNQGQEIETSPPTPSLVEEKIEETTQLEDFSELPEAQNSTPFILHQEKPLFTPEQPLEVPALIFQPPAGEKKPQPKPLVAKIETPGDEESQDNVRVVHYSEYRTPLDGKRATSD